MSRGFSFPCAPRLLPELLHRPSFTFTPRGAWRSGAASQPMKGWPGLRPRLARAPHAMTSRSSPRESTPCTCSRVRPSPRPPFAASKTLSGRPAPATTGMRSGRSWRSPDTSNVRTSRATSASARRASPPIGPARQQVSSPSGSRHTSCFKIAMSTIYPPVPPGAQVGGFQGANRPTVPPRCPDFGRSGRLRAIELPYPPNQTPSDAPPRARRPRATRPKPKASAGRPPRTPARLRTHPGTSPKESGRARGVVAAQ